MPWAAKAAFGLMWLFVIARCVWTAIVMSHFELAHGPREWLIYLPIILACLLWLFLAIFIQLKRNWARISFLVCVLFSLPINFYAWHLTWSSMSPLRVISQGGQEVIQLLVAVLLLLPATAALFRNSKR